MYGNGVDAYNAYRRTGFPTTLQPNMEPNPGSYIRSLYYPQIMLKQTIMHLKNLMSLKQFSGIMVQLVYFKYEKHEKYTI